MFKHWQDWINYFFGLWLFGSPWFLEHSMLIGVPGAGTRAMLNLWVVGLAVVLLTTIAINGWRAWTVGTTSAFGAWLLVSPWILGFTSSLILTWNSVIFGALIFLLAGWSLMKDRRLSQKTPNEIIGVADLGVQR